MPEARFAAAALYISGGSLVHQPRNENTWKESPWAGLQLPLKGDLGQKHCHSAISAAGSHTATVRKLEFYCLFARTHSRAECQIMLVLAGKKAFPA